MNPLALPTPPVLKRSFRETAAFSLVKVTLAIGATALCLFTVFALLPGAAGTEQVSIQRTEANNIMTEIAGDLRAVDLLSPGQASKEQVSRFGLHNHWAQLDAPDTLFFSNDAELIGRAYSGTTDPPAPAGAVFRAKITYLRPPNASTSAANVLVSWPAQVDPATDTSAGKVETFIAVDR